MPVMDLDFYGLIRPVQERFIASTRALAVPTPLAVTPATLTRARPWFLGSAVALAALVSLTLLGFGSLHSPFALASMLHLGLYATLLGTAAGCLLRALALRHKFQSLPFRPGAYLFPVGVIEARSALLRLHPLLDLKDVQIIGKTLRLLFSGGASFDFTARGETELGQLQQLLQEAKRTLQLAEDTSNRRELARLDPLRDNGFSNPFAPTGAFRQRTPAWAKGLLPLALLIGTTGGYGLWKARNVLSEGRLYTASVKANSVQGFQAYLARGGDRAEVREILLPRAELKRAEAQGTVESIETYIDQHPTSRIGQEVNAALRSALLTALEQAKAQGTLTAIATLKTRYKNVGPIDGEIAQAETEVFQRAFEQYRSIAPSVDKNDPVPFFQRLFDFLKRHGPKVEVRWRRQLRESVRQADNLVKLSAYFMGNQSIPSQYFDADRARKREGIAAQKLLSSLQPHFPTDILRFETGAPFDAPDPKPGDEEAPLPTPEVPTLFITHNVEMTGGYMNPNPRGIFVGAGLLFDVAFAIPGDPEVLPFKFSIWRPPDLTLLKQEGMTSEGMYESMAQPAFDTFVDRYAAALVKPNAPQ